MYPRRSRFSPQIRPGTARQQRAMTIWAYVFLASIGVMFAAFVLSGNFGVHEFCLLYTSSPPCLCSSRSFDLDLMYLADRGSSRALENVSDFADQ